MENIGKPHENNRKVDKIATVDISVSDIEGSNQFTYVEKHIMSLILIRKMQIGVVARIVKVADKAMIGTNELEQVYELEEQIQQINGASVEVFRNLAMEMGITPERFEEIYEFVYAKETKV